MRLRVVAAAAAAAALLLVSWALSGPGYPGGTPAHDGTWVPRGTDACVRATVRDMDPGRRAGQLLLVGVPAGDIGSAAAAVSRYHLGGVFLRGHGTTAAADLRADLDALQRTASVARVPRLHVAVDQEGGRIRSLRGPDFPALPAAVDQGRWQARVLDRRIREEADRLRRAGITLDLAPVADTVPAGSEEDNPPVGALDRQYGADPGAVADDVVTVVTAMQSTGVLTTLKHFPGLGRVRANTDHAATAVDTATAAGDPYLGPFRRGIAADAAAVMVSSARYPRLDPRNPAVFSSAVITGLLRGDLSYRGLVVSDDLGQAVAVGALAPGARATAFVAAGGDLVLTVVPRDAGPMYDALLAEARRSATFRARVESAVTAVLASKRRAGMLACPGL